MLFHKAVSKVLQSSLNFSEFLCFSLRITPESRHKNTKKRPIPVQKSGIGRYFKAYLIAKNISF